jgi:gluconolactonase
MSRRAVLAGASSLLAIRARAAEAPAPGVERLDSALDALIDPNAVVETIMTGSTVSEGPLWIGGRDGYLLVSDPPANLIRRWSPRDGLSDFLRPAGYAGPPSVMSGSPGANGLILARGGVVMADQGNRGLALLDLRTRKKSMLCRDFEGRRFNSPNDIVLGRDGSLYFTDPPWGLMGRDASPYRELDYMGVFRLARDGTVTLIDRSLVFPNGIGLSPDGRTLYAAAQGGWYAWALDAQGRPSDRRTFFDGAAAGMAGGDSLKVDASGHIWAANAEGLHVFSPRGQRIGLIRTGPTATTNCEFGADGWLYITAFDRVVRLRAKTRKLVV